MDIATIAHISTLQAKLPFIHFFDGFRVSHEINTVNLIPYETYKELYDYKSLDEYYLLFILDLEKIHLILNIHL